MSRERETGRVLRPAMGYAVGLHVLFFELKTDLPPTHHGAYAYRRNYDETITGPELDDNPGQLVTDLDDVVVVCDHALHHYGTGRVGEQHGDYGAAIKYPGSPHWYIIDLPHLDEGS